MAWAPRFYLPQVLRESDSFPAFAGLILRSSWWIRMLLVAQCCLFTDFEFEQKPSQADSTFNENQKASERLNLVLLRLLTLVAN